ncbi:50S ribosomal protein L33 [Gracilibacillus xinjiangensis]|uniref:Large ribosomal subunit protein bL33 n=1 Tax=Gracilibacillus xinjiangensis TaxID=1193282 RepID=A0ABV8WYR4_9BACI
MGKKIVLACEVCHNRNYSTDKNNTNTTRMEVKKFCKKCNQHTVHRETK